MTTTSNNNNIENKNQEFFTKGKKYRCIKSVKGNFTKGKVYEQSSDPTQWYGYFHNDKGILHVWPQPAQIDHCCELYDMKPEGIDPRLYFEPVEDTKETEDIRKAFTVVPDYYSEYQKLGHQEQRPQEWLKKTTDEKRATYYRACVELERLAGDGLPLVIRADSADLSVNPWNALEKRVKTARVFHLGDRVKMQYPYQCDEVTGTICGIRFGQGCTWLGGWCTHYDVRFDEEYQRPNNFGGKDTGVGMVSPERIELVERAEFCPEPAADWLQPGEKVAHYLDYGDGTGDWLTGNVTGYELCDDGTVIVIYGEYRTPLKNMVKYRYEMDHKTA